MKVSPNMVKNEVYLKEMLTILNVYWNLKVVLHWTRVAKIIYLLPNKFIDWKWRLKLDVLQSIKQPEQCEMLKRYNLAKDILKDPNVNMDEYQEAIGDFSVLENWVIDQQIRKTL